MSRVVYAGGVSVVLTPEVYLVDADEPRPVYHRHGDGKGCGAGKTSASLVLPARHAKRFGRPCLRCWPELRSGQLELKAGPL